MLPISVNFYTTSRVSQSRVSPVMHFDSVKRKHSCIISHINNAVTIHPHKHTSNDALIRVDTSHYATTNDTFNVLIDSQIPIITAELDMCVLCHFTVPAEHPSQPIPEYPVCLAISD